MDTGVAAVTDPLVEAPICSQLPPLVVVDEAE
jgi:hypothetical protein